MAGLRTEGREAATASRGWGRAVAPAEATVEGAAASTRRAAGRAFMAVWLVLGALAGCATTEKPLEMFWPDPPDEPRIRYVTSLRGREDAGAGPGLVEYLVGPEPRTGVQQPMGVALSEDGQRVYVADFAWSAVFVFDFAAKKFRTIGSERYPLAAPIGVALDAEENVYVTDTGARAVRVYDRKGEFLRNIGKGDIVRATGVAIDKARRRLYAVDTGFNDDRAHNIKVFTLDGTLLTEFGRRGGGDGEFRFPTYAAVDREGRLYVVDSGNFRVQVLDPDGTFLWKFGETGDLIGRFARPKAVALDPFGNIYVTDSRWNNVQIFNQRGNLLLFFGGTGTYPGLMLNPAGIAIDSKGRIYVADTIGRRVNVYQLVNTTAEDSWERPASPGGQAKRGWWLGSEGGILGEHATGRLGKPERPKPLDEGRREQ